MTTKDKTGDQLTASIRKAKAEGTIADKPPGGTSAKAAAPKAAAPAAKPSGTGAAAKQPPVTKKRVAGKREPATRSSPANAQTGYQSPGRVWPD